MALRRRSAALLFLLLALLAADGALWARRARYRAETARLRAGMTALERARADALLAAEADRATLGVALIRRQAAGDDALHLAVNVDSGYVALERGAVRLRRFPAEVAPDPAAAPADAPSDAPADPAARPPATVPLVTPRGLRHVERVMVQGDPPPDHPGWPEALTTVPWPTPLAVVASGGALIYAPPDSGPLAPPQRVLPGAVRVAAGDLAAIRASITPGMRVYFF